jgi:hypothetical protein
MLINAAGLCTAKPSSGCPVEASVEAPVNQVATPSFAAAVTTPKSTRTNRATSFSPAGCACACQKAMVAVLRARRSVTCPSHKLATVEQPQSQRSSRPRPQGPGLPERTPKRRESELAGLARAAERGFCAPTARFQPLLRRQRGSGDGHWWAKRTRRHMSVLIPGAIQCHSIRATVRASPGPRRRKSR